MDRVRELRDEMRVRQGREEVLTALMDWWKPRRITPDMIDLLEWIGAEVESLERESVALVAEMVGLEGSNDG